jgi:1-acyl-sn-glycerol-3-phosphate acyltransferase
MSAPKHDKGSSLEDVPESIPGPAAGPVGKTVEPHPAGRVKFSGFVQVLRLLLLTSWFNCCCASIHLAQWFGAPLYFFNKDYFYAYMALTKQSFAYLIISLTQWFTPTVIRVSGDISVRGQLRRNKAGLLETNFPERLVVIMNHQIYVEWVYLWWIAYTNKMHGHVYIILKESLKYIPFLGPGMMFYGFIFMARNWAKDKARLAYRLKKLKGRHNGPLSGSQDLDPMWLIIFPEGTNLSANTRKRSAAWAAKQGIEDLRYQLLPRSTGLQFCLQELNGTIQWVYDCTAAYEGVP